MAALNAFTSSVYPLHVGGVTIPGYAAFYALLLNLTVSAIATIVMNMAGVLARPDQTTPDDYHGGPETAGYRR